MKEMDYWLAKPDPKDVANKLMDEDYAAAVWSTNPVAQTWIRNSIAYFMCVLEPSSWDTSLIPMGHQGELVRVMVPMARQLIRQIIAIITRQNLSFSAIAEKSSSSVSNVMRLAEAYISQLVSEENVDEKFDHLLELMFVHGSGFMGATFETDKGYPYMADAENNQLFYSGKVAITNLTVWDMLYDFSITDWDDVQWIRARRIRNRYDLIAQFPHLKEQIASLPSIRDSVGPYRYIYRMPSEDDLVYCNELYHKKTPALTNGRMCFFSDPNTIYHDGPLLYTKLPYHRASSERIFGTGFGYPLLSNLMPVQEMLDTSVSTIATNQSAFGVQNVTVPRGANINVNEILGMNFISYTPMPGVSNSGKPEPLNLTQTPNEIFKFYEILNSLLENLSGVNAALRGTPPPQVSSGTAIATLTSTAIESINSGARSAKKCLEVTMMNAVNAFREFGSEPYVLSYAGQGNEVVNREVVGSDLDPIKNVKLNEQNPLMKTLSGRLEIANQLLAQNPQNIKAYFEVLEGEPPTEMYDKELSEEDLMKRENEELTQKGVVKALNVDDHPCHMAYHAKLLNDPKIRIESDLVESITAHILEHYQLAKDADPAFMAMVQTGKIPEGGLQSSGGAPMPNQPGGPGGPPPPMGIHQPPPPGNEPPPHGVPPGGEHPGTKPELMPPGIEREEAKIAKPAKDLLNRG